MNLKDFAKSFKFINVLYKELDLKIPFCKTKVDFTMTYLERYQNGEYKQVWDDLLRLKEAVRDASIYPDALAVSKETMRRVRENIEILIDRLLHLGYIFGYDHRLQQELRNLTSSLQRDIYIDMLFSIREQPPVFLAANQYKDEQNDWNDLLSLGDHPFGDVPLLKQDEAQKRPMSFYVDEIEKRSGFFPLSFRAWYEEVGAVNFYGYYHKWDLLSRPLSGLQENIHDNEYIYLMSYCDPLQVCVLDEKWMQQFSQKKDRHTFDFALDCYGKDYYSGSSTPYSFQLPTVDADVLISGVPFVDYLRNALLIWAGFPGMETWPVVPKEDLSFLTHNLIPF